ncbi:AEC family transporter [Propionivibrio sp.]|uniref:AEC family transporter n=1 Tax=Propionivibrio sp. TaxID=2212460 RepID=UPI0025F6B1FF|nr:AEC family transporter [Propionivibrio sp.]MBK7356657.1 AEC family transporter [Propionivibrio sp.]MBK8401070.1 AEC family transporter [Propionivibrio sp.]MBK8744237.1 AEC family transporter [Propionivibrio sp.]MBK8894359.1 AEC family transporter [Propionivibrio sp.]MBL0208841.1 AEC family transporter [Propionivibrio sp.]
MIDQLISTMIPVTAVVLIGFAYAYNTHVNVSVANRLNTEIFLPALVFSALATRRFDAGLDGWLIAATAIIVIGSGVVALPIARWMRVDAKLFCPPMMFSNCGTLGLPLALLAFGEREFPHAMLLFVTTNLMFFTLGAYMIGSDLSWRRIIASPVVMATVLGILSSLLELPLPRIVLHPVKLLGDVSLPLMLFSLGVRMTAVRRSDLKVGFAGALVCPMAGLLIAGLLVPWLPLAAEHRALLFLFAALPPAVVNHLLAESYLRDPEKMAAIVVIGNAVSVLFIPFGLSIGLVSMTG